MSSPGRRPASLFTSGTAAYHTVALQDEKTHEEDAFSPDPIAKFVDRSLRNDQVALAPRIIAVESHFIRCNRTHGRRITRDTRTVILDSNVYIDL